MRGKKKTRKYSLCLQKAVYLRTNYTKLYTHKKPPKYNM